LYSKTKVGLVKFAEDGAVVDYKSFQFKSEGENLDGASNSPTIYEDEINFRVMSDFEGNLYRISIAKKGETTLVPKFRGRM